MIAGVSIASVTEDVAVTPSGTLATSGALTIADVDQNQSTFTAHASVAGTYGTFTLAANGAWTYTALNSQTAIQQLGAGQSIADSFTAVSSDGTASQLVTVTINGTNDIAVIGTPTVHDVTEDTATPTLTAIGSISISDIDTGENHFQTTVSGAASDLGGLVLAADGSYTYSVANSAVQFLAGSTANGGTSTHIDSFTVTAADGTTKLVSFTIHGSNDAAVIGTPTVHDVTEDVDVSAGYLTAIGTISISDVDTGEGHFQTIVSGAGTNLGSLLLAANGSYTYSVLNSAAQTVASTHVDTFTVTAADGTTQSVSFTIHSTNDAPVIQDHVVSKMANISADGGQLVFSGGFFFGDRDFTVSDPDGPQFGIAITSLDNANGMWEYQLAGTTTWTAIKLAAGEALLLSANDKVRFNGAANAPIEVMTFKAWDGSDGLAAGTKTTITSVGGSTAFSVNTYSVATKNNGPAGITGEPINLGLADPSLVGHAVTVTISDLASDWIVNGGTHNADGSWTVQTSDVSSLSVTTSSSFGGATLVTVTETMVQADGTTTTFTLGDNIEAYSQGSPIFAWSGDDFLTASSGKDLLVFSQPIGHDTVYSFDAAADQIDLIGYANFTSFADVQAHMSEDAAGNAVIAVGTGQSITLQGIDEATLTENIFVFDQTATLENAGTMTIGDGAMLPLSGHIHNTGVIALDSTGDETDLQLIENGVTLDGGGQIVLSDSDANIIAGTSSTVTLNNEDNTISGAGQLGNGELSLTNAGTIDATGVHLLTINTGSNIVFNSGTLEASGAGGLRVASSIANSGVLWANAAYITVQGEVSGSGIAKIDGAGTIDFEASSTANVVFGSAAAGTLKLGDAFHFNGTIFGFTGSDTIDLADLSSATASLSYSENPAGGGGTLTISDGSHSLELSLVGAYSADNFSLVADHAKGTVVSYVPHDLIV
ncbi:MAG: hypothetical protein E6G79_09140 [Alphaproteobacteria bacterium]|nr:MAG: hypothetical protein E6G79_09140 [Alphaproteobacteria bacterium]